MRLVPIHQGLDAMQRFQIRVMHGSTENGLHERRFAGENAINQWLDLPQNVIHHSDEAGPGITSAVCDSGNVADTLMSVAKELGPGNIGRMIVSVDEMQFMNAADAVAVAVKTARLFTPRVFYLSCLAQYMRPEERVVVPGGPAVSMIDENYRIRRLGDLSLSRDDILDLYFGTPTLDSDEAAMTSTVNRTFDRKTSNFVEAVLAYFATKGPDHTVFLHQHNKDSLEAPDLAARNELFQLHEGPHPNAVVEDVVTQLGYGSRFYRITLSDLARIAVDMIMHFVEYVQVQRRQLHGRIRMVASLNCPTYANMHRRAGYFLHDTESAASEEAWVSHLYRWVQTAIHGGDDPIRMHGVRQPVMAAEVTMMILPAMFLLRDLVDEIGRGNVMPVERHFKALRDIVAAVAFGCIEEFSDDGSPAILAALVLEWVALHVRSVDQRTPFQIADGPERIFAPRRAAIRAKLEVIIESDLPWSTYMIPCGELSQNDIDRLIYTGDVDKTGCVRLCDTFITAVRINQLKTFAEFFHAMLGRHEQQFGNRENKRPRWMAPSP